MLKNLCVVIAAALVLASCEASDVSETPELLEIDAKWSLKCDRVNGCGAETIITEPGDDAEFSLYIVPTPKEDEIVAGAILELPANTKENVGVTLRFGDIRRAYTIRACSKEICFSRMALFPDQFDSLKKENALRVVFDQWGRPGNLPKTWRISLSNFSAVFDEAVRRNRQTGRTQPRQGLVAPKYVVVPR